jgi:hypothetical protein
MIFVSRHSAGRLGRVISSSHGRYQTQTQATVIGPLDITLFYFDYTFLWETSSYKNVENKM